MSADKKDAVTGISIDELPQLKKLYDAAVEAKHAMFEYRGVTLVTDYAKYLIEYFEGMLQRGKT